MATPARPPPPAAAQSAQAPPFETTYLPWHYDEAQSGSRAGQAHNVGVLLLLFLLSVTLLVTLFFLYTRRACRYRHAAVVTVSGSASPGGGDDCAGGASKGLDRRTIDGLPMKLHAEDSDQPAGCSICLTGFEEGEKVKVLPGCEHPFHPACVDRWLESQPTCPLCRASLSGVKVDPLELV